MSTCPVCGFPKGDICEYCSTREDAFKTLDLIYQMEDEAASKEAYARRGRNLSNPEGDDPYYWCHGCGKHAIYGPRLCWECSPGEWERAEEEDLYE